MQDLVFDFLSQHIIINRKNLEKIAKGELKKVKYQFQAVP